MVRSQEDKAEKLPNRTDREDKERAGRNVGDALRQAYDETVAEAVPDSMLDLLKKLD